jgi:putative flippase GtrA
VNLQKLIKFGVAGLPSFLVAIPLNYLLVTRWQLAKPAAYALVLGIQVTINFFACYYFVFATDRRTGLWRSFGIFCNGILLFRLGDWAVYSVLTSRFALPFIGVQLFNVALFGLLKYEFSRRVFESRRPPEAPPHSPRPDESRKR